MTDTTTSRNGPGSPSSRPSKKFLAAAAVVAAVVAVGLVLSLTNLFGESPDQQTAPAPAPGGPAPVGAAPAPAAAASVCGLAASAMSGTVAQAPVAAWSLVGTTAAPSIKDAGPGRIDSDGYRSCYAHTPVGAVVCAANLVAMGSVPALERKVIEQSTLAGAGRKKALAEPATGGGGDPTEARVQIAGFRVLRYDGATADVDLALRTSNGALAAQVFNLAWSDGDWKFQLDASGDLPVPVVQVPDLTGYLIWAGA